MVQQATRYIHGCRHRVPQCQDDRWQTCVHEDRTSDRCRPRPTKFIFQKFHDRNGDEIKERMCRISGAMVLGSK